MSQSGLAEHHVSIEVPAPVHEVYELFSHFTDFPKFMTYVNEVTYIDEQRSHWVADVVGRQEWDAVNEGWVPDRQIGWRSTTGLENTGRINFTDEGPSLTRVDVDIAYNPPAGVIGDIGENLGAGAHFESRLKHDLEEFANMVREAPPGALDPTSSSYLFHSGSAAAREQRSDGDAVRGDFGEPFDTTGRTPGSTSDTLGGDTELPPTP